MSTWVLLLTLASGVTMPLPPYGDRATCMSDRALVLQDRGNIVAAECREQTAASKERKGSK